MICRYKIKFISDIEQKIRKLLVNIAVAPFVGVWIEMSHSGNDGSNFHVAPFVGVWIEIYNQSGHYYGVTVAPFVGVWIEIDEEITAVLEQYPSLPSWECGLKFFT